MITWEKVHDRINSDLTAIEDEKKYDDLTEMYCELYKRYFNYAANLSEKENKEELEFIGECARTVCEMVMSGVMRKYGYRLSDAAGICSWNKEGQTAKTEF